MFEKKREIPSPPKVRNLVIFCVLVAILLGIALLNARLAHLQQDDSITVSDADFQVHMIDVGQGDAVLVIADGNAMLIDAGEPEAAGTVCAYLEAQEVGRLTYAVATHMHADHIGGMARVLTWCGAGALLEPGFPEDLTPTNTVYERYLDAIGESGTKVRTLYAGDSFRLGSADVQVLGPVKGETPDSLNNTSLVLRVQYDDVVCLFTGDMERSEEETLLHSGEDLRADLLKAGHHGSETSSGEDFLAAVRPEYVFISCGRDNSYGHPAESTLERLRLWTQDIHVTAEEGHIVFLYDRDGKSCNIVTQKEAAEDVQH
ncbi:MAG: MBL fold metallo-hydrolase [Oscillospiraceae bacterium]|nr:MBL fold metallo-hydrolase [Oscillospiraceae bacterium]